MLSLSGFPLPICHLSIAPLPVLATWPLLLLFLFFPDLASQWLFQVPPLSLSASWLSAFAPPGFPCFPLASQYSACLSVSFRLSRFRSHSRYSGASHAFAFGLSPPTRFLINRSSSVLTTQPSDLSFPFFPFSPVGGSFGAFFLFRPACFHAFLPISVLSFLQFLSPFTASPHSGYLSASAFPFGPGRLPLACALGLVTWPWNVPFSDTSWSLRFLSLSKPTPK